MDHITHAMEGVSEARLQVLLGLPLVPFSPRGLRGHRGIRFLRRTLGEIVRERLSPDAPQDFLTDVIRALMERFPRNEALALAVDNAATFYLAGHETTANTTTWTLYLLSQFPDADEELAREVAGVDAAALAAGELPKLPFTSAVLEEAMRLYPPAPFVSREAVAADVVGGTAIAPHTSVLISTWILHRHRLLWQRPDEFDPTRFLPAQRDSIPRFAYLPFGAGPRICIGMSFAMQEAMIVLTAIARRFRLELDSEHKVEPLARITLRPKGGLKMRLHRR
jgi:cytochrome P450